MRECPRLLIFTNVFPRRATPNTGFYVYEQVSRLAKDFDVRVVVAEPRRPGQKGSGWTTEEKDGIAVDVTDYGVLPKVGVFLSGRSYLNAVKKDVARIHKQWPFDLILAYWTYPEGHAAGQLAKQYHVPLILRPRGSDINVFLEKPGLKRLIQQSLSAADRVIPVTRALMERIGELGVAPERLSYLHNGLDHREFFPMDRLEARQQLNRKYESKIILFAGNFYPVKGVVNYCQAIERLDIAKNSRMEFLFLGRGDLTSMIARLSARVKHVRIEIIGDVSHDQLHVWMNAADVLCLPSLNEGCPNVVLEALACGVPVAASRVGGVPELLTDPGLGKMFAPDDPEEMAAVIQEVVAGEWDRSHIAASVKNRSWDDVAARLKSDISEVLKQKS